MSDLSSKEEVIRWLHRINITGGLGMDAHAALDNALLYLRSAPEPPAGYVPIAVLEALQAVLIHADFRSEEEFRDFETAVRLARKVASDADANRTSEPPSDAHMREIIIKDLAVAAWADPEPSVTLENFLAWMRSELQGFAPSETKRCKCGERELEPDAVELRDSLGGLHYPDKPCVNPTKSGSGQ